MLKRSFFARRVDVVARALIGAHLVSTSEDGPVTLRITECEAYGPEGDSAAHARFGNTARTAPMFGPPGHSYVYLCYGIHWMLNLICEPTGVPTGILIRSCEVVDGLDLVLARRRAQRETPALVAGPGKVAQALALDGSASGLDLCAPDAILTVHKGLRADVVTGPRVGIDYASPADQSALRRYALKGSRAVTSPKTLAPSAQ